jgi:hypothetical protein
MLAYLINLCTFLVLTSLTVVLVIGSSRGLWHKGYMAGLEACRVKSLR